MAARVCVVLVTALVASLAGAVPAGALVTHPCPRVPGFGCATLRVPLDRAGRLRGTVALRVAVQPPRPGARGFLLALSGGPGQPAVPFANAFRATLAPLLAHRRLVVLDQRGTGASGLLRCPALQRLGAIDAVGTHTVEACARALGPRRQRYATADSVADIEALRHALGARRLLLMGISYGTFVATQYARRHPAGTAGLILDSTVGPDGVDAYYLDTFARLRRVLTEQCARGRCAGATADPVADVAAVVARLRHGPLRGSVPDARGVLRATAVHDQGELLLMLMAGDLNPFLQAALPGALAAARRGDPAPLLRLRRYAEGPPTPARELSGALNVATTCADIALPYTFLTPFADRWTLWQRGADAVPTSVFAPFTRDAAVSASAAHDCLRWPYGDMPTPPSTAPLPDVPALILSGRLDTRTPTENAREVAAQLPHAQLVTVAGTGHDVLDSDITGCASRALRRFAAGRPVGHACARRTNAVDVLPRPPATLAGYRVATGVAGVRGRVVSVARYAIFDAQISALQALYAGFARARGGGLRAGSFAESGSRLRLRGYALVRDVRVTGTLDLTGDDPRGTLAVAGPGRVDGALRFAAGGVVTGTLGGRAVRFDPGAAAATAARGGRAVRLDPGAAAATAARRRPRGQLGTVLPSTRTSMPSPQNDT